MKLPMGLESVLTVTEITLFWELGQSRVPVVTGVIYRYVTEVTTSDRIFVKK